MNKLYFLIILSILLFQKMSFAQPNAKVDRQKSALTIDGIMRDPSWFAATPTDLTWDFISDKPFFKTKKDTSNVKYWFTLNQQNKPVPVVDNKKPVNNETVRFSQDLKKAVYEKDGNIFYFDGKNHKTLIQTESWEYDPVFSNTGEIIYRLGDQLFMIDPDKGTVTQLTYFVTDDKTSTPKLSLQDTWLKNQSSIFEVFNKEETTDPDFPKDDLPITYLGKCRITDMVISPNKNWVVVVTVTNNEPKGTQVPNYVTQSGYTESIKARPKVGHLQADYTLWLYDRGNNKCEKVSIDKLPGIFEQPAYLNNSTLLTKPRLVAYSKPLWSSDSKKCIFHIRANDNKDRWIVNLKPGEQPELSTLERQHNDAWVGGPGIDGQSLGFTSNANAWWISEKSGYAHLQYHNFNSNTTVALTKGNYEIQSCKYFPKTGLFYITSNAKHPGEKHYYTLNPVSNEFKQLTTLEGGHETVLSNNGKTIAYRYSNAITPWEIYIQQTTNGAIPLQITKSTTTAYNNYNWQKPEIISFKAKDGTTVYARLYSPKIPQPNASAVVFVHGAGYLQNAHKWWSNYFREFFFHNLLADEGYYVLDIDYRASAGYGTAFRTGIYRHMGGKDLDDQIDGINWLVKEKGVNRSKIGIYGGSYGGFITLMALFTKPDVFACGAALRPVTDWAHYNHGYTSNILNTPQTDSLAYAISSPINFAAGLKNKLLICHGLIDINVHAQDAIRLSQRLIELKKENWELALYPVEDHGFIEPSSWTDEYKRIYKLFQDNLK